MTKLFIRDRAMKRYYFAVRFLSGRDTTTGQPNAKTAAKHAAKCWNF